MVVEILSLLFSNNCQYSVEQINDQQSFEQQSIADFNEGQINYFNVDAGRGEATEQADKFKFFMALQKDDIWTNGHGVVGELVIWRELK